MLLCQLSDYSISEGIAHWVGRVWTPGCEYMETPGKAWGQPELDDGWETVSAIANELDGCKLDRIVEFPDQFSERIVYYDNATPDPILVGAVTPPFPDPIPALAVGSLTEVCRVQCDDRGVTVVDKIETFVRVQPLGEGGFPDGPAVELRHGTTDDGPLSGFDTLNTPYPNPIAHPLFPGSFLVVYYVLQYQRTPHMRGHDAPRVPLVNAPNSSLPLCENVQFWFDSRNSWDHNNRQQWMVGGSGLLQLFVGLGILGVRGTFEAEVAGRLQGYRQRAGRNNFAVRNTVTTRRG